MKSLALLLLLGSYSPFVVKASTDDDESITKAKKKFHSYQSDPMNLLRGIDAGEYEQIYIKYHQCVWSEFEDGEDDGEDSGCNGDGGDENNPWYMGNTQCYRANVAYSLYGVPAGDETPSNACRKKFYINSFFTKSGMSDFGSVLGLENYGDATSQCTLSDDGNEEGNEDGDNNSFQHKAQLYPNAQSYTTYCANGKFVTAMFSGAYCTGKGEMETINEMSDLNDELDELDCVLAYSADDNNGRFLEEEGEEGEEEEEKEDKTIWDLLSYSSTCSILEYPKGCPDPYGVKKSFDLNPRTPSGLWRHMYAIDWVTLVLFVLGTLLFLLTCCIKDRKPEKKRRFFGRGRSKSPANSRKDDSTVDTNGDNVQKKKRGIKGFFSRKK